MGWFGQAPPQYDANQRQASITFWGDRRSSQGTAIGRFNSWIVKRQS